MTTYRPPRPSDPYDGAYDELIDSFEPEIARSQPSAPSFSLPRGSWLESRLSGGNLGGRTSRNSIPTAPPDGVETDTFGGFDYDHEDQTTDGADGNGTHAGELTPLNSTSFFQMPYNLTSTPTAHLSHHQSVNPPASTILSSSSTTAYGDSVLPSSSPPFSSSSATATTSSAAASSIHRSVATPIFPDDSPLLSAPSPLWLYVGRCANVLARDMWDFAVPLILVELFPSNIMAPSVYSLFSIIALLILSPLIATLLSRASKRRTALAVLSVLQVVSTVGSSCFMLWLIHNHDERDHDSVDDVFWSSWQTAAIFAGSVLFGLLSPVNARLLDEAVDFEWISLLYDRAERVRVLGRLETCVSFVRVVAPVFTGLLLSSTVGLRLGIKVIIAVCVASLVPAVGCLGKVVAHAPGYTYRHQVFWTKRFPNPIAFLMSEWSVYSNQAVFLVMLTNLFLCISIFNPHSSILIAMLKCFDFINHIGVLSNPVLGGFRGVSAFFGFVLGPFIFEKTMLLVGLIPSTQIFVSCAAILALMTALFFQFAAHSILVFTILVLCTCLLEEFFSCGFGTGEDQILQAGVPRKWRNTLHVAQMGLTDMALFIVYSGTTVLSFPANFPYLIWATFGTIGLGSLIFATWSLNRTNRNIVLLGPISTFVETHDNPDQDSLMLGDEIN